MKNVLEKMIAQLSEEDKLIFGNLASKLEQVDGDISKLSAEELNVIGEMESKYSEKLAKLEVDSIAETDEIQLLETGFGNFVRQLLARDLKEQFPNEEDAVRFAFQNKWIPQDLKEPKLSLKIFEDFQQDICEANQWREEVVGVESDKSLAVGLTWFMVLFQLNQRLN